MPNKPLTSLAMISSNAASLSNFRGPLIRTFIEAGTRVWALAPDHDDASRAALIALGAEPIDISLDRAGIRPMRDLMDVFRLRRTLRRLRPDATFGYFIKPVIYGAIAARLASIPRHFSLVAGMGYVFTPSGDDRQNLKRRLLKKIASSLYRLGFRLSERVFFHNPDDLRELVTLGWLPEDKTRLLGGTGVDLSRFQVSPPSIDPLRFVMVARLLREKGVFEFAEAARRVREYHPHVQFDLVGGTDPNPGALSEEQVRQWTAEGILTWHGHVGDVRPFLSVASVFVLPSYREGKPRSTQEAMAMGRAVITTNAVGCRDTVEDGRNGFQVPVEDAEALAKAMLRFVNDPALAIGMGEQSRILAEERFDVRKINAAILATLGVTPPPTPDGAAPRPSMTHAL